jgi:hypothetical protein
MDKTKEERKSALKLINKYAESYSILEEENKQLKSEVNDLKLNLKINKEIIEGLYSASNKGEKTNMFQLKLKEEHQLNIDQIEKLNKEKEELRYRIQISEQMYGENLNLIKSENEKLKSKIFVMDNCIIKKDNLITQLKKKLDNTSSIIEKEIYITDPTDLSIKLHYEVAMYKEIYHKLMSSIKDLKTTLYKYEKLISELQIENTKLTHEMKYQLNTKYEREREEHDLSCNTVVRRADKSITIRDASKSTDEISTNKTNLSILNRKYYELEEWWSDALRNSNMTADDYKRFKNNKAFAKIADLIEFLNNIILDKNYQIKMIEKENHMLNDKLESLNKENMSLYEKIKDFANTKDTQHDSMNNNLSNNLLGNINDKKGLGLVRGYQQTMESVTSGEFRDGTEVVNMNYFTNESMIEQMDHISINLK